MAHGKEKKVMLNYPFRGGEPGPTFPVDSSMSTLDFFLDFSRMRYGS